MRFHDFFAGIGGSSTGLCAAGMEGVVALNHWHYAIELHNANHPGIDHDEADIWKADPRKYRHAEVGWLSPECRSWSNARGKKDVHYVTDLWRNPMTDSAEDRSRMLMESVPFVSEKANYRYVIVENVVDVVRWSLFNDWLQKMTNLGYEHKLLFLNSQFFGTPQSRDRFFAVFWKRGEAAPNLDFRPPATCPKCGDIDAVQAWKPGRWAGKYKQQYVYVCPHCAQQVEPDTLGAETILDWSLPMPRIGDRPRGLSDLTLRKIRHGLEKFGAFVVDTSFSYSEKKARPIDQPLFTQTTCQSLALTVAYYGRENAVRPASEPLPVVPTENKIGLAYIEVLRKNTQPTLMDMPMPTVTAGGNHHALVMANYGSNPVFATDQEPMPTVTTIQRHALLMTNNGQPTYRLTDEPMTTVTTVGKHVLIEPEIDMDDVRFRMLEPRELSDGTGFPHSYILFGTKRDQVRGIGHSVDSHVACWLGRRIMEAVS